MPLNLPSGLPAYEMLKQEAIHICPINTDPQRTLKILLLNLMPLKEQTETDFARLFASSELNIELTLIRISGHESKNTSKEHLDKYYKVFAQVRNTHFDGMVITGAPVEHFPFEDVLYWKEVQMIFDWAKEHINTTLYICWAAQAALYHFHGIDKQSLPQKQFGIFKHRLLNREIPLFRGFDDEFYVPHSRHTTIHRSDIVSSPNLALLSESDEAGVYIIANRDSNDFYITGHSEYAADALHKEYVRDISRGLPIDVPVNYYKNDDPRLAPVVRWRAHSILLFNNWIKYYVNKKSE